MLSLHTTTRTLNDRQFQLLWQSSRDRLPVLPNAELGVRLLEQQRDDSVGLQEVLCRAHPSFHQHRYKRPRLWLQ
jgi:hypothetical protein